MAKFKKTLACLLAALLLLSCVQSVAFAAYNEGASGYVDYSDYVGKESIADASVDQVASMALDWVDEVLALYGEDLTRDITTAFPQFKISLLSVDMLLASFAAFVRSGALGGDFNNLSVNALLNAKRANGDLKVIYAVLQFLADNDAAFAKLVDGTFDFGNLFTIFGASEEEAAQIKEAWTGIDGFIYSPITEALGVGEGETIDSKLNDMINGLLAGIQMPYADGQPEGATVGLNVTIDITTQSLYEIIDALLEGFVRMYTEALTHKTFSKDDTFGDYLATLINDFVNDVVVGSPLEGFVLDVRNENLYTIIKNLVDALISGNEEAINGVLGMACDYLNEYIGILKNQPLALFGLMDGEGYETLSSETDAELFNAIAEAAYNDDYAEVVEYNDTTYYVTSLYRNEGYYVDGEYVYNEGAGEYSYVPGYYLMDPETGDYLMDPETGDYTYIEGDYTYDPENGDYNYVPGYYVPTTYEAVIATKAEVEAKYADVLASADQETKDLMQAMADICALFNDDIAIEIDDFGLIENHDTYLGFIGELNHIAYVAFEKIFAADTFAAMGLTDGGLDQLTGNIWALIQWLAASPVVDLLKTEEIVADVVDTVVDAVNASSDLPEFAVALVNAFAGDVLAETGYVEASSLEELAAFFLNYYAKTQTEDNFYDEVIFDGEGGYAEKTAAQWKETLLSMLLDLGMVFIDEVRDTVPASVAELLPAYGEGWTYTEKLDEIVDCIMNVLDGLIPAIDGLTCEKGVLDGNGPWYKLSKVLNSLLPLGIVGGCAKTYGAETLAFDLGVLVEDKIYGGVMNLDLGEILSILTVNNSAANIFFTKSLFDAAIAAVQNLVNGILPGTLTDELVESLLTAITAENLIQLVRNLAAAISGRGPRLEAFVARVARIAASVVLALYDEEIPAEFIPMLKALTTVQSMEEVVAMALNEFVAEPILGDGYDAKIYDGEGFKAGDRAYWKGITYSMLTDLAVYELNDLLPEAAGFDMDAAFVAAKKDAGWGYEEFLDEIVDWAFSYLHGFLPVLDNMPIQRGVLDGNGAFYKISVLLNSLLPMSILDDCDKTYGKEVVPFDVSVVLDKVYNLVTELDVAGIASIFNENTDAANPFSGNALVKALLIVLQNLVNGLMPGTISDDMIVNIDTMLKTETLAAVTANFVKALNGRKAYLVPSIVELVQRFGLLDFAFCSWLQCAEHNYVKSFNEEGTSYTYTCSECGLNYDLPLDVVDNIVVDDETQVAVAYDDNAFEEEVTIVVEEKPTEDANLRTWKIEPKQAAAQEAPVKVQPVKPVQVRLPIPEGWNPDDIYIKHVKDNSEVEYLPFEVIDGFAVCWIGSFSDCSMGITNNTDKDAAAAAAEKIDAIGNVVYTDACKALIETARAAYNGLTDLQKSLVKNLNVLSNAEETYNTLKLADDLKLADKAAAAAVDLIIAAIGKVEYNNASKAKIDAARAAYNALTADQKAQVAAYGTLTAAEARYAELKAAAEASQTTDPTDKTNDSTDSNDSNTTTTEEEKPMNFFQKIMAKIKAFFGKISAFFAKIFKFGK